MQRCVLVSGKFLSLGLQMQSILNKHSIFYIYMMHTYMIYVRLVPRQHLPPMTCHCKGGRLPACAVLSTARRQAVAVEHACFLSVNICQQQDGKL